MRYNYCPKCGTKLTTKVAGDEGQVPFCDKCNKFWFDSFQSSSVILLYNQCDEIVLCRQSHISADYATLNSGIIKPGETAESTAVREVEEELGIKLTNIKSVGTSFYMRYDTLLHWFIAYVPKCELHISRELESAEWVSIDDAPEVMLPDEPGNAVWGLFRTYLQMKADNRLFFQI